MEEAVEFFSEGVRLRGYVTMPDGQADGLPAVLLCHGFGCVAAMDFPEHAARLADRGYAVLRFDYRHWGESDGEPRSMLLPLREVEDVRNAITFMQQHPRVDPERIGIWGASFGGGIAIHAAATDRRAKAVVATVPATNGRRWLESINTQADMQRVLREIEDDRKRRLTEATPEFAPFSEFRPADPSPSAAAWLDRHSELLGNRVIPWRSVEAVYEFAPDEVAGRISPRALLIIGAPLDTVAPWEQAERAYRAARDPKRLIALPPTVEHFDVYVEPTLTLVMQEAVEWFDTYLGESVWISPDARTERSSIAVE